MSHQNLRAGNCFKPPKLSGFIVFQSHDWSNMAMIFFGRTLQCNNLGGLVLQKQWLETSRLIINILTWLQLEGFQDKLTFSVVFFVFKSLLVIERQKKPSASVDNTLLDLQNSSYPTQPHSIIYTRKNSENTLRSSAYIVVWCSYVYKLQPCRMTNDDCVQMLFYSLEPPSLVIGGVLVTRKRRLWRHMFNSLHSGKGFH